MQDPMAFLEETARAAGAELRQRFRREVEIQLKADQSLVTAADLAAEEVILARIARAFPDDGVLSEESGIRGGERKEGAHIWVIDPLDGTANFANGFAYFAVSIARTQVGVEGQLVPVGACIYDPIADDVYLAGKGEGAFRNGERLTIGPTRPMAQQLLATGFSYNKGKDLEADLERFRKVAELCLAIRRPGAAALDLAHVAAGVFGGFWEKGLSPWDVAAAMLIVSESGGEVRDFNGGPCDIEGPSIVAGPRAVVDSILALL